jgi:hypothetical protein
LDLFKILKDHDGPHQRIIILLRYFRIYLLWGSPAVFAHLMRFFKYTNILTYIKSKICYLLFLSIRIYLLIENNKKICYLLFLNIFIQKKTKTIWRERTNKFNKNWVITDILIKLRISKSKTKYKMAWLRQQKKEIEN